MTLTADIVRTSQEAKTLLYLLPSEAETVIVQTKPSLAISVLLPPTKREINVDYYTASVGYEPSEEPLRVELECPHIIWTQVFMRWRHSHRDGGFCQCLKCHVGDLAMVKHRQYKGGDNPYRYFMYTPKLDQCTPEHLYASDYSVANCDDGYVCWGKMNYPPSLRQASIFYWMSRLNNSPGKYNFDTEGEREVVNQRLAEKMQNYIPNRYWDRTKNVFGTEYLATSEKTQAVLLSFDEGLSAEFEDDLVCGESENAAKALVGFANRNPEAGGWHIDLNGKSFTLLDEDVVIR